MPKPSPAKKRKRATNKGKSKPPKKAKRIEKEQASEECEENAKKDESFENETNDCEDACSNQELVQLDIDKELDRNASKSKLSVFNVKSIIHHVLSDERVVAMACQAAEDEKVIDDEEKSVTPGEAQISSLPESLIEPKLTRSRVRLVAETTGTAPDPLLLVKETIIHSPLKNVVSPLKLKRKTPEKLNTPDKLEEDKDVTPEIKVPLAALSFPEEVGSSDEEYDPLKEPLDVSEDDSESCVSNAR